MVGGEENVRGVHQLPFHKGRRIERRKGKTFGHLKDGGTFKEKGLIRNELQQTLQAIKGKSPIRFGRGSE